MYTALLRSLITYACPVWGYAADVHMNKLQIFQNKVLRLITKLPRVTPRWVIHRDTGIPTIKEYIENAAIRFRLSTEGHENPLVAGLGIYNPGHTKHKTPRALLGHLNDN